jgi:putative cell wall-binding protein
MTGILRHGTKLVALAIGTALLVPIGTALLVPIGTALLVPPAAQRPLPVRAAAATSPVLGGWAAGTPGTFRIASGDPGAAVAEAPRRRVMILQTDQSSMIPAIKRANPQTVVLAYKDLSSARDYDPSGVATGVGWTQAQAHPDWFATDGGGQRVQWKAWPGCWQMNVGNPGYQATWAANVTADLRTRGFDGAFMDNALTAARAYNDPPATQYPTDAAMRGAVRSLLAVAGPALRDAGLLAIANIDGSRIAPGLWGDWINLLDGAMEEHFANWNPTAGGPFLSDWGPDGWRAVVDELGTAAAKNKIVLAMVGGAPGDREAMRYGLASYLLANDGRSVVAPPEHAGAPWYPEFDWDLGAPLGAYHGVPGHPSVYQRNFTGGTVIVNASLSAQRIDLAAPALDYDGNPTTAVSLGATRAAILRSPASVATRIPYTRIAGATAIGTSVATSQRTVAAGTATAVAIARVDSFADALAGAPLAGTGGGAVLLTRAGDADPSVVQEAKRALAPGGTIYLLGGTAALAPAVENAFLTAGLRTVRLAGPDRYGTAVEVARRLGATSSTPVMVVSGVSFPDAIVSGPAAVQAKAPILLVTRDSVPGATAAWLSATAPGSVIVVGGTAAVSDAVAAGVGATERVGGADRYATAVRVAQRFFPSPDVIAIATGTGFADALSAAPSTGRGGTPLLLTGTTPTSATTEYIRSLSGLDSGLVFGGTAAVSASTLGALFG